MKRRYRYMLNLFSLGVLFFALYLNFVKKESEDVSIINIKENVTSPSGKEESKPMSVRSPLQKNMLK